MGNVNVVADCHELKTDDYCRRYSYGDDVKIRSDLNRLTDQLTNAITYGNLEEVGYLARKMSYTAHNVETLYSHNEMIERARRAVLDVPKGQYVTRYSVRQLFFDNRSGYDEFAYGATIVALEELVADGALRVVRTNDGIAYKRI